MSALTPVGVLHGILSSPKTLRGTLQNAISEQTIKRIEDYVIEQLLNGETVDSIKAQVIADLTEADMLVTEEDRTYWNGIVDTLAEQQALVTPEDRENWNGVEDRLSEADALVTPEDRENWNEKLVIQVNPNNPKNLVVTLNS